MAHHHFTRDDRVLLAKLKTAGLNNASCARILGFHLTSIGRELKRGAAATATKSSRPHHHPPRTWLGARVHRQRNRYA